MTVLPSLCDLSCRVLLVHFLRFNIFVLSQTTTLPQPCSHPCILLLIFLLVLGQKPVEFIAQRQESSPGASVVILRWTLVGAGIQLIGGAALCVQLAVHLLATSVLRVRVRGPAVFQHGMDVANRHRQAGKGYEHDNHSQSPARVL